MRYLLCLFAAFMLNAYSLNVFSDVGSEHSGSWYNPNQSGHGFSFEYGESGGQPFVIVYWYTYDENGGPLFLVGAGTPGSDYVDVTFEVSWGMAFGVFDPNSVNREIAGVGRFFFDDDSQGNFEYIPSDFAVSALGHSPFTTQLTKLFDVVSEGGAGETIRVEVPVYIENAVVSQVISDFDGFEYGNFFELANGMVFQQTEFYFWFYYAYRPDIVIYQKNGAWQASVDGISKHVKVARIR